VLLQLNKIVHQVWKLLDMFGRYRLQGTNPHEAQSFLQAGLQTENHQAQNMQFPQMYGSLMFGLWSGLNQQMMKVEFLSHLSALPSLSTVDSSGSADRFDSGHCQRRRLSSAIV
jgi:hypothetical protein